MLRMAITIYVNAFLPLCLLSLALAWRWGGSTERFVAWAFVIATLLQKSTQGLTDPMFSEFELFVALLDFGLLIALLRASFRDPQTWLLIATALQLLSSLAHAARLADVRMTPLAYAILMGSGGYPTQLLLIYGIIALNRRRTRLPTSKL